jgi:hypothetical protein
MTTMIYLKEAVAIIITHYDNTNYNIENLNSTKPQIIVRIIYLFCEEIKAVGKRFIV